MGKIGGCSIGENDLVFLQPSGCFWHKKKAERSFVNIYSDRHPLYGGRLITRSILRTSEALISLKTQVMARFVQSWRTKISAILAPIPLDVLEIERRYSKTCFATGILWRDLSTDKGNFSINRSRDNFNHDEKPWQVFWRETMRELVQRR